MYNDLLNTRPTPTQPEQANVTISADWFDVDDSWKPSVPPGDYVAKVSSYKLHHGKNDPTSVGFMWTLTIVEGEYSGKDVTHYTWLGRQDANGNLTKKEDGRGFRLFLQAIGVTPKTLPALFANGTFTLTDEAVLNNLIKINVTHEHTVRNDAKGKPASELQPEDYMTNLKVSRVYAVEPAGKKWTGGGLTSL